MTDDSAYVTIASLEDPDTDEASNYHAIDEDSDSASEPAPPAVEKASLGSANGTSPAPITPTSTAILDPPIVSNGSVPTTESTTITPNHIPMAVNPQGPNPSSSTPTIANRIAAESTPADGNKGINQEVTIGAEAEAPSSPVNPFPFEECEEAPPLYLDANAQASPPASPPVSRPPSPTPSPPLPVHSQPLPADVNTPVDVPLVPDVSVVSSNTTHTTPQPIIAPTAPQASRKRKVKDVVEGPIIQPGAKRQRIKTQRALAGEEQSNKRQRVEKDNSRKGGFGKENAAVSGKLGKGGAAASKGSRKRR